MKSSFYGWKLLVVFWFVIVLNFAFPTFGMSVVNTYMAGAMHLDRKELGLAYSVFALMAGLPGPIVGYSINRFGIRLTMLTGILLVAFGSLLMAATVHTAFQAILVLGLVVGFGAALSGTIGPQVGVARWFHAKRGRAMSLFFTSSGIGGFLAVPILNRVISASGGNWRSAWWCMGAMSLCSAVLAAAFIRESPAQLGQQPDGGAVPAPESSNAPAAKPVPSVFKTTDDWTLGETLRTPVLWLLLITYLGFFMGFFIYVAHGIVHLEGLGHSPAAAARSLAILMLSSVIGQAAVATLGDRVEMRYIFAVSVALFGFGMVLATRATGAFALYPYAICMGSGFAASYTCLATMQSNYFGPKVYPALLGISTPVGTILGSIGPIVAGWFYDMYGSYTRIFYLVAAVCFASAVLLPFAKPPARRAAVAKPERATQAV